MLSIPNPNKTFPSTPSSGNQSETSFLGQPSQKRGQKEKPLCYQYVNPNLLLQWQGDAQAQNQIAGCGIFRAYQRSKDGNHKSKLMLSLEANQWKDGKPNGDIKMIQTFFYDNIRQDNVVKQVRKFVGKIQNMKKEGQGQYTIQYFYSNETKKILQIKGTWVEDNIVEGTITENGNIKEDAKFLNNVEVSTNIYFNGKKTQSCLNPPRQCSREKLKSNKSNTSQNKCLVVQISQDSTSAKQNRQNLAKTNLEVSKQGKANNSNLLTLPDKSGKANLKNLR